ncbi:MAG: hypothetical protein Q8L66_05065 [Caulobacter sp.]|nr:hypothetical protein [Caulobacter sp.]
MRSIITLAAMVALPLAACGKTEDSGKAAVVATSPDSYTIRGEDGAVTVAQNASAAAAAASGLPDFAPLFPGARVSSTVSGVGSGARNAEGGSVVFTSDKTPRQIIDFYKARAAATGLASAMDADMGAALMFVGQNKADKRGVQVMASPEGGGSTVTVTWTRPKT